MNAHGCYVLHSLDLLAGVLLQATIFQYWAEGVAQSTLGISLHELEINTRNIIFFVLERWSGDCDDYTNERRPRTAQSPPAASQ